jgi:hypothetical protein
MTDERPVKSPVPSISRLAAANAANGHTVDAVLRRVGVKPPASRPGSRFQSAT